MQGIYDTYYHFIKCTTKQELGLWWIDNLNKLTIEELMEFADNLRDSEIDPIAKADIIKFSSALAQMVHMALHEKRKAGKIPGGDIENENNN